MRPRLRASDALGLVGHTEAVPRAEAVRLAASPSPGRERRPGLIGPQFLLSSGSTRSYVVAGADTRDLDRPSRLFLANVRRTMTDQSHTTRRINLLNIFGLVFATIGMSIGVTDSYGVLSFACLGLGLVLLGTSAVLAIRNDDSSGEQQSE